MKHHTAEEIQAKIDDLIFSITPDASVRWAKLQKGECHVMPYPNPADLDTIRCARRDLRRHRHGLGLGSWPGFHRLGRGHGVERAVQDA